MPLFVKFAFVKWLNVGIAITGLTWLIYHASAVITTDVFEEISDAQRTIDAIHTDLFIGWFILMAITFGLQLYGEHRHNKAMAAKQQAGLNGTHVQ